MGIFRKHLKSGHVGYIDTDDLKEIDSEGWVAMTNQEVLEQLNKDDTKFTWPALEKAKQLKDGGVLRPKPIQVQHRREPVTVPCKTEMIIRSESYIPGLAKFMVEQATERRPVEINGTRYVIQSFDVNFDAVGTTYKFTLQGRQ